MLRREKGTGGRYEGSSAPLWPTAQCWVDEPHLPVADESSCIITTPDTEGPSQGAALNFSLKEAHYNQSSRARQYRHGGTNTVGTCPWPPWTSFPAVLGETTCDFLVWQGRSIGQIHWGENTVQWPTSVPASLTLWYQWMSECQTGDCARLGHQEPIFLSLVKKTSWRALPTSSRPMSHCPCSLGAAQGQDWG